MNAADTAVLLDCCATAPTIAYHALGFHDADIAQDVCVAMIRQVETFDGHGSLGGWLRYKGRKAALDAYRDRYGDARRGLRPQPVSLDADWADDDAWHHDLAVDDDDPLDAIDAAIDDRARIDHLPIEGALTRFRPRGRAMIRRVLAGETQVAVATAFGVTEAAVSLAMVRFRHEVAPGTAPVPVARACRLDRFARNADIVARSARGESRVAIARAVAVSASTVQKVLAAPPRITAMAKPRRWHTRP